MIKLILITNDPKLARQAESCGIDRIFVDLEILGKKERQGHLDTHISGHSIDDIAKIKSVLDRAELLIRLNPLYESTQQEVEEAITHGADILMLPMYRTGEEVAEFVRMVDGRVKVIPLLETFAATQSIRDVVKIPGVTEMYIGLNDLHLDMGLRFMFEPIANGLVDKLADIIKDSGLPFGFGGIARVGEGIIPGELVLGEHLRLGSNSVILSRTFQRNQPGFQSNKDLGHSIDQDEILATEIRKLETAYAALELRSTKQIDSDHRLVRKRVQDYIENKASETSI